jgi:hypothetical protein
MGYLSLQFSLVNRTVSSIGKLKVYATDYHSWLGVVVIDPEVRQHCRNGFGIGLVDQFGRQQGRGQAG